MYVSHIYIYIRIHSLTFGVTLSPLSFVPFLHTFDRKSKHNNTIKFLKKCIFIIYSFCVLNVSNFSHSPSPIQKTPLQSHLHEFWLKTFWIRFNAVYASSSLLMNTKQYPQFAFVSFNESESNQLSCYDFIKRLFGSYDLMLFECLSVWVCMFCVY